MVGDEGEAAQSDDELPYALSEHLLTPGQRTLYDALQAVTPSDLAIFPRVRLANLVAVTSTGKRGRHDFYRIQGKLVDFVLCDAITSAPRMALMLEDPGTWQRPDEQDAFVDAVLARVGLPLLRVRRQPRYSPQELALRVGEKLGRLALAPNTDSAAPPVPFAGRVRPVTPSPVVPPEAGRIRALPSQASAPPVLFAAPAPAAAPVTPMREMAWACGQCHRPVRKDTERCPACGARLN
ncbi:MAG: hypothetical protein RLZZ387_3151 [Chloroflexota bacterium]